MLNTGFLSENSILTKTYFLDKKWAFGITKSTLWILVQFYVDSNRVVFSSKRSQQLNMKVIKSKTVPMFLGLFLLLFTTIFVAFRDFVFEVDTETESDPKFELFITTSRSNVKVIKRKFPH